MAKKTITSTNVVRFFAFIALVLSAFFSLLEMLSGILALGGSIIGIFAAVKGISLLIAIGLAAYDYVAPKKKAWKIVFWVCIAIFVIGILYGTLSAFNVF